MSIIRVSKRERWVTVDKTGIEDDRLSFKATGLLTYLLSKPDNWEIRARHLIDVKTDGRASVLAGLKELEETGYLRREKRHTQEGTITWEQIVYEVPPVENRHTMSRKPNHGEGDENRHHDSVFHSRETGPRSELETPVKDIPPPLPRSSETDNPEEEEQQDPEIEKLTRCAEGMKRGDRFTPEIIDEAAERVAPAVYAGEARSVANLLRHVCEEVEGEHAAASARRAQVERDEQRRREEEHRARVCPHGIEREQRYRPPPSCDPCVAAEREGRDQFRRALSGSEASS